VSTVEIASGEAYIHGKETVLTWGQIPRHSLARHQSPERIRPSLEGDENTPLTATNPGVNNTVCITAITSRVHPPVYKDRRPPGSGPSRGGRPLPEPPAKKRPRFYEAFAMP
jgi:hypothetical protein